MQNYVYDLSNNNEVINVWKYIKLVYDYIKDKDHFRDTSSTLTIRKDKWEEISNNFPELYNFKNKYNMAELILFLEYKTKDWYEKPPHAHTGANCSIFFPIRYSEFVKTDFYEPLHENTHTRVISGGGFTLKECFNTKPSAGFVMSTPHFFRVDKFHRPTQIKKHNDNLNRIVCSWESNDHYLDMIKRFKIDT